MKTILELAIVSFFLSFCCQKTVFAKIWINEIYPAPGAGETEWVEIFNDENIEVGLTNYILTDLANNKIIFESPFIASNSYALASSSNVLNNTGDTVFLKHSLDGIIEIATYSGTLSSDKTYAKCPDGLGSWYTLTTITKNSSNNTACLVLTPTPTITVQPTPAPSNTSEVLEASPTIQNPTLTTQPISHDNIYISEVMVNPETGEKEWIEIYNNNDSSVSLNNWYIDDIENTGSAPKIFSLNIDRKSYQVYQLTSSVFNNDGDQVRLLDFNKNLKDSFEYLESSQGKSWGRISFENDDFCLQEPSKSMANNSCINPTTEPTASNAASPKPTKKPSVTIKLTIAKPTSSIYLLPSTVRHLPSALNHQPSINSSSPQILGVNIKQQPPSSQKNTAKGLSFISFSYSLLTIASVFFKIKFNV